MSLDRYRFVYRLVSPEALIGYAIHLLLLAGPAVGLVGFHRVLPDARAWMFLACVTIWYGIEIGCARRRSVTTLPMATGAWLPVVIGLSLFAVFFTSFLENALRPPSPANGWMWLGGGMMLAGATLRGLAIRRLGPFFLNEVTRLSNQPLITNGVYSRLRHPSETGTLCLACGAALLLGSWTGLAVSCALLWPGILYRIQLEDRILREGFPKRFAAYSQSVPALIPRLRKPAV